MPMTMGSGNLIFEPVEGWEKLPNGWAFEDAPDVAVDSKDNVYVINRSEHPVIVLDREGNFLRSWGEGFFSVGGPMETRAHAIHIGPDDSVYCVDDALHTVQKFTPEGKLLMTLGTKNQPSPKWSGQPFNGPSYAAVSPVTGDIYIAGGHGDCRIYKFSPDGKHILSWGEPGIDPGNLFRPHSVLIDKDDNIYVAEKFSGRIQVFDPNGKFLTMWNNIYTPNGMCLDSEENLFVAEEGDKDRDGPGGMGRRVSIYNLDGKLLTRLGDTKEGEGTGQFVAPHGIAVDSHGDIYVGEVSLRNRSGRGMGPPQFPRRVQKFARKR